VLAKFSEPPVHLPIGGIRRRETTGSKIVVLERPRSTLKYSPSAPFLVHVS
jgi:hypothetical protein